MATLASATALVLALGIGVAPLIPPSIAEDGPEAFSLTRALEHIQRIAVEPHPIGTPAIERVRREIVAQLATLGLPAQLQAVAAPDYYGTEGQNALVVNVAARIHGVDPTGAIAVVGHYDTVPTTPGANDDASAVAVMLESARAILAGEPLRNDVILLFTDGEEPAPRFGSSAFVTDHAWFGDVGFVVNLEAVGDRGPSTVVAIGGSRRWIIDQLAEALPYPVAYSYLTATVELTGGSNTDFAPFRDAGVAGVELAYLHGSQIYHTPADAPDRVSPESLHQHGANALALVRHLGNLDLRSSGDGDETVFFTIAGRVVRYPAGWGLPVLLLAGAVLAAATGRRGAWLAVLRGAGVVILSVVVAALVAVSAWSVVAGLRPSLGVAESYAYLLVLAGVTVAIVAAVSRLAGRRLDTGARAAGTVAVWWVLGALVIVASPGMGYPLVWPAMAGAVAVLWWRPAASRPWWQAVRLVLVAGPAVVLTAPAVDTFYQLAQPRPGNPDSQILSVIVVPAALIALLAELIRSFRVGR